MLFLNNETKPFNDKAFRKALNMVDRPRGDLDDRGVRRVAAVITSVTGLPLPAGRRVHGPGAGRQGAPVDVDGAKEVLTDAGYTWDGAAS